MELLFEIIIKGEGFRSAINQGHKIYWDHGTQLWFWRQPREPIPHVNSDWRALHRQVARAVLRA